MVLKHLPTSRTVKKNSLEKPLSQVRYGRQLSEEHIKPCPSFVIYTGNGGLIVPSLRSITSQGSGADQDSVRPHGAGSFLLHPGEKSVHRGVVATLHKEPHQPFSSWPSQHNAGHNQGMENLEADKCTEILALCWTVVLWHWL